jgi:ubiquinone biosynthesis protein
MTIGRHPIRQIRRSRQIGATFIRHGFGFAWEQIQPSVRARLGRIPVTPPNVPAEALAEHFRLALEKLGPTFVKLGQVLSTRPDLLPPAYIAELSRLQDQVPAAAWEEIRAVLVAELGRPVEEVFASIEPVPMAAASLAQVHAATLADGTEVVVKVQRPGIEPDIETDLAILAELAAGAQLTPLARFYDFPAIVDDFSHTLRNELDYRREGRNADRFRHNFRDEPHLYIPAVYWEHTTRHVLVLERLTGIKIDDLAALEAAGVDRKVVALRSAQIIIKEVLEDGFFHADPHPGNFFVMHGGEVIGAVDFGMVGHLDEALQFELIRLYAAAVEMDVEAVVDELIRMGAASEDVDRRGLVRDISRLLNKYRGLLLKDIRAADVIADIMPVAFRHRLQLPSDLWLLGKTMSMLEGVGLRLDPDFDMFAVSAPIIRRLAWRLLLPRRPLVQELMRRRTELADLADLLPRAAERLLRQAERGDLFSVRFKELDVFLGTLERLATRVSISLIIAALILSTALLSTSMTGNLAARILIIAGFIVSSVLGAWLVLSMWWPRRRR